MADQLKLRGGPTAQAEVFVGAEREVTVDTGLKALRVHDGVTPGGHLIELKADANAARVSSAASDATARALLQSAIDNALITMTAGDSSTLVDAKAYTDTEISNLIGGAPDLLNTLNELADSLGDDNDFITTLTNQIAAEAARVDALIASGMWLYSDQSAFPAAASNHGRVVHSHADGAQFYAHAGQWIKLANNSQVTAIQSTVDANEAVEVAARSALSARIDVLEVDPTTSTALANQLTTVQGLISAVQTDVNLNEADADAAISAEETARITADTALTSSVTAEATARTSADTALQTNITAEETSRVSAVATLTATINTNEAAHVVSHNALQGSIDTINVDRTNLEERLLHAGLATGILYVSNFAGG